MSGKASHLVIEQVKRGKANTTLLLNLNEEIKCSVPNLAADYCIHSNSA